MKNIIEKIIKNPRLKTKKIIVILKYTVRGNITEELVDTYYEGQC